MCNEMETASDVQARELILQEYIDKSKPYFFIHYTDPRLMEWLIPFIIKQLKRLYCRDFRSLFCYTQRKILFYAEDEDMAKHQITIGIPYDRHTEYIDPLFEMNLLVEESGMFLLFVNNIPYELSAFLIIHTNQHYEDVLRIAKKHHLPIRTDKGFDELFEGMKSRRYNMQGFVCAMEKERFVTCYQLPFAFPDKGALERHGYGFEDAKRKKVFISYCHDDKDIVYAVTDELERRGVDLWIDKKDLQSGTPLLRSILSGIEESDVAVSFVSNSMQSSVYAQAELDTILTKMTTRKKKWCFIKIDGVNVDAVFPALSQFVYINYAENRDVDEIADDILRKINRS